MDDKEMLELAAKAAGKKIEYWHSNGNPMVRGDDGVAYSWNPRDDGDLFRLAVDLGINIEFNTVENVVTVQWRDRLGGMMGLRKHAYGDRRNTTRQSVLYLAAKIGKDMP